MYRDGLNPLKLPNYQEQCLIIKAISEIPTFLMFHEINSLLITISYNVAKKQ